MKNIGQRFHLACFDFQYLAKSTLNFPYNRVFFLYSQGSRLHGGFVVNSSFLDLGNFSSVQT